MKKIIMLAILVMTVFSCELVSLLDNEAYQEMKRDRAERGVRCYKNAYGNIFCEDKYGNRVH